MFVALVFAQRLVLSKKNGGLRLWFAVVQGVGLWLGAMSVLVWAWSGFEPALAGDPVEAALVIGAWGLALNLLLFACFWIVAPGRKVKGDVFGSPRRRRPPSASSPDKKD